MIHQQTRHAKPMPIQCRADVGPTFNRHWFNVSCLLGVSGIPANTTRLPNI